MDQTLLVDTVSTDQTPKIAMMEQFVGSSSWDGSTNQPSDFAPNITLLESIETLPPQPVVKPQNIPVELCSSGACTPAKLSRPPTWLRPTLPPHIRSNAEEKQGQGDDTNVNSPAGFESPFVLNNNTDSPGDCFTVSLRSSPTLSASSCTSPPSSKRSDPYDDLTGGRDQLIGEEEEERGGEEGILSEGDMDIVADIELGKLPADFLSTIHKARKCDAEDEQRVRRCMETGDKTRWLSEQHRLRANQRQHHLIVQQVKGKKGKPILNVTDRQLIELIDNLLSLYRQVGQFEQQQLKTQRENYAKLQRCNYSLCLKVHENQIQQTRSQGQQYQCEQVMRQLPTKQNHEIEQGFQQLIEHRRVSANSNVSIKDEKQSSVPILDLKSLSKINQMLLRDNATHNPIQRGVVQSVMQAIIDDPSVMCEKMMQSQRRSEQNQFLPDQNRFSTDQNRFLPEYNQFHQDQNQFWPMQNRFQTGQNQFQPEQNWFQLNQQPIQQMLPTAQQNLSFDGKSPFEPEKVVGRSKKVRAQKVTRLEGVKRERKNIKRSFEVTAKINDHKSKSIGEPNDGNIMSETKSVSELREMLRNTLEERNIVNKILMSSETSIERRCSNEDRQFEGQPITKFDMASQLPSYRTPEQNHVPVQCQGLDRELQRQPDYQIFKMENRGLQRQTIPQGKQIHRGSPEYNTCLVDQLQGPCVDDGNRNVDEGVQQSSSGPYSSIMQWLHKAGANWSIV